MLVIRVLTAPHLPRTRPTPTPENLPGIPIPNPETGPPEAPPTAPAGRRLRSDIQKKIKRESITTTTQHPATRNAMAVTASLIFASRKKTQQQNVCVQDPTTKNSPTERREKPSPCHQAQQQHRIPRGTQNLPASPTHPPHQKKSHPQRRRMPSPLSHSPRPEALVEQLAQARILCASHAPYPS